MIELRTESIEVYEIDLEGMEYDVMVYGFQQSHQAMSYQIQD